MKPRIRKSDGRWLCEGVAGRSPREAFNNWRMAVEPWRVVPCGYVPRIHGRPA